jgi:hypothetical protein
VSRDIVIHKSENRGAITLREHLLEISQKRRRKVAEAGNFEPFLNERDACGNLRFQFKTKSAKPHLTGRKNRKLVKKKHKSLKLDLGGLKKSDGLTILSDSEEN